MAKLIHWVQHIDDQLWIPYLNGQEHFNGPIQYKDVVLYCHIASMGIPIIKMMQSFVK